MGADWAAGEAVRAWPARGGMSKGEARKGDPHDAPFKCRGVQFHLRAPEGAGKVRAAILQRLVGRTVHELRNDDGVCQARFEKLRDERDALQVEAIERKIRTEIRFLEQEADTLQMLLLQIDQKEKEEREAAAAAAVAEEKKGQQDVDKEDAEKPISGEKRKGENVDTVEDEPKTKQRKIES